jgi:hypothetical protein
MSKPLTPSHQANCSNVHFVEVDLPRLLQSRLVIQFSSGLTLLLEDQSATPHCAEFVATPTNTSKKVASAGPPPVKMANAASSSYIKPYLF